MAKPVKTNVLRHLDAHKIPYETREYDVSDENYETGHHRSASGAGYAWSMQALPHASRAEALPLGKLVSAKVGLPAEMIYKTLVLTGDHSPVGSKSQYLVCVIPVEMELDLKAVARATGNKSVAMLPQKDLLPLTGYLRGGCSPIGMKKAFPTYIQQDAEALERISVSAGVRGCQVILAVDALVKCTNAKFAELCRS